MMTQDNPYGIAALWLQGDFVIKGVAILLLIMSVCAWTIILLRLWRLWSLRRLQHRVARFWQAPDFQQGLQCFANTGDKNPFYRLLIDGQSALEYHQKHAQNLQSHLPLNEWLSSSLRTTMDESLVWMQRGLSILASIGATAPFIGLFGTVWGIYHALVHIGVTGQASIDKVAGPVGEALIMTALGLAVAIPAVLGYNALVRANKRILVSINRFAQQLHVYFLTGQRENAQVRPLTQTNKVRQSA